MRMCLAVGGLALLCGALASLGLSAGFDPPASNQVASNESPEQIELLKQARETQDKNNAAANPSLKDKLEIWFRAHRPFAAAIPDQTTANDTPADKTLLKEANDAKGKVDPSGKPTLKDTLEKGLKARQPEEFSFVRKVVHLVDSGRLPRSLVDSTFLWARTKEDHPFQYFQMGLTLRAKKMGIAM